MATQNLGYPLCHYLQETEKIKLSIIQVSEFFLLYYRILGGKKTMQVTWKTHKSLLIDI